MKNAVRFIGLITIAAGIFSLRVSFVTMGSADPLMAGAGGIGLIFGIGFIVLGIGVLNGNSNCIQFLMLLYLLSVLMEGYNFQKLINKTREIRLAIDTFDVHEHQRQHQQRLAKIDKWRYDFQGNEDPATVAEYNKELAYTSEHVLAKLDESYNQHKEIQSSLILRLCLSILCLVVLLLGSGLLI